MNSSRVEAPGGEGRGADPHSGADHRRPGVERHRVAVDRDARIVQAVLGLLPVELASSRRSTRTRCTSVPPLTTPIPAARASRRAAARQASGALQCPPLAVPERLAGRELERHRLGGDHVLERAALLAREHDGVDLLAQLGRRWPGSTPPRGPPSVLCVVEVTTWACGSGDGCSPAATRPAKCAMSTIR